MSPPVRSWARTIATMIRISWRADAARSIGALVTATGQMASAPLVAIGMRIIANGIAHGDARRAIEGVAIALSLLGAGRLSTHASFNIRMRLRENTQLYLDAHIMELTAGIPGLEHHERPEYLDEVELIRAERGYLANPFNPISWTVASVVQNATVLTLLWGVHPALTLLPLAGAPTAILAARLEQGYIAVREGQAERQRFQRHLLELTTEPPAAKEVRIYGLGPELLQRRRAAFDDLEIEQVAFARRHVRSKLVGLVGFGGGYALAVTTVIGMARAGRASVGDVVLVLSLGAQIDRQLAEMAENLAWFVRTHRAVRRLRWFGDYAEAAHERLRPDEAVAVPPRLHTGIEFAGVGFAYPGTKRSVLAGVDLTIPRGTTVAIVGENGAGKTTLMKLLCRFYEPTAGEILLDGIPLTRYPVEEWRTRISAGFQDFAKFELVAREVVGLGDLDAGDTDPVIEGALARASASDVVSALPDGFDSQLGRQFDGGVELSIGQWQKLALGRSMMRTLPLVLILDEPTASLDSTTEHALFERFHGAARQAALSTGAITILVSHRFSTVRMADLILVVDGGLIAESGTHAELLALGGHYADLYSLQARSYR